MDEYVTFGAMEENCCYSERLAAYAVIARNSEIAMVRSATGHFLPGGGSLAFETPEDTVVREVREELGRQIKLLFRLGEAIQYFYSAADKQHYKMLAVFFVAEFTDDRDDRTGEHQLEWLHLTETDQACFHECHAWAIRKAGE